MTGTSMHVGGGFQAFHVSANHPVVLFLHCAARLSCSPSRCRFGNEAVG